MYVVGQIAPPLPLSQTKIGPFYLKDVVQAAVIGGGAYGGYYLARKRKRGARAAATVGAGLVTAVIVGIADLAFMMG